MQQSNNGPQNSPTNIRSVNGINQQNFIANTQAMMASFNASNGTGMATSPSAGLSMPSVPVGSPRGHAIPPNQMPALAAKLRELEAQYRSKNPSFTQDQIRRIATEHLSRIYVQRQQQHMSQSAMNAAAGAAVTQQAMTNGLTASASPHQYAQILRAQQAQGQVATAQQAGQHQRQPSGSATSV
jgi:chromatin modification-related protein VID21